MFYNAQHHLSSYRLNRKTRRATAFPSTHQLESLERRALLAAVASVTPASAGLGVGVTAHVSVKFASTMTPATVTSSTFQVQDSSNTVINGRISYNSFNNTATFDSAVPLTYGQTYHVVVKGGGAGVLDSNNGTMAADYSWSFTTAANPNTGSGGPILIITSSANPFSSYYGEILRAEGLNEFATADISTVSAASIGNYKVVVLSEMALSAAQVTILTNWVNGGGNLIAMRPDKQLSSLLGLTDASSSLSDTYLQVNTATPPGTGITGQTMQFHGAADKYTLNGATAVATLFSNATTGLSNPAVTIRTVGSSGGQAAAFTYDLAKSVIYTRQGNPAWSGQERDGIDPIRSDDLFFGNAASDPQTDWLDLNKVAIPQADEQQRLLANMIEQMNLDVMPLPKFWYLPNGNKAVVVLSGDDHGQLPPGTASRFSTFNGLGNSGGQPVRATSYVFVGALTDSQAAQFEAMGFDVSLHTEIIDGSGAVRNWTSITDLNNQYTTEISQFEAAFPSLPSPITTRMHGIVWSDFDSQPQVEFANGIRLDETYYYWPGTWTANRPGMFTGSGMPMRFAKADGTMIDVYQAATQLVDENASASWPGWVDSLLDGATGSLGYYGAFTVNAHNDNADITVYNGVISSAKAHNVPVITSEALLNFTDARNGSSFSSLAWNNTAKTMSFNVITADGAGALQGMLPLLSSTNLSISSIKRDGVTVPFTVQTIKGIAYAFFGATSGSYVATYAADTVAPTITSRTPANAGTGVLINAKPSVTFSEDVQPATITMILKDQANNTITGTVGYDSATHTASFTPTSQLISSKTYTLSVSGAKDLVGNTMSGTSSATFTTLGTGPFTIFTPASAPGTANSGDASAAELGVKFRTDVSGLISGIRFYKSAENTGVHVGSLWSSTGTLLAQGTFSSESGSGWQQVNFSSPVAVTAGTTYVASYHTNVGNYSVDVSGLTTGVDGTYIHALGSGVDGGNGVFLYTANSAFPSQSFGSANYWVDAVFSPPAGDTTAPTITGQTPASGSTGAPINSVVTALFSEAVQSGSISMVLNAGATTVAGTTTYNTATLTATFTPSANLSPNTVYTMTVSGASDTSGNVMASTSWSFTTTAGTGTSLWPTNPTPAIPAEPDNSAVELGVKFRSTSAGFITGIRFYKGTGNTGTHVAHLWSPTGTLLGTATYSGESATGWQAVSFASPIAVTANTTYVASYYAPVGHYAVNLNYFNSAVTSGPLTAPDSASAGGNGVFRYATGGGFPNQTWSSSNYWVDPVFSSVAPDTTAPTITTKTPASAATGVPINAVVTAVFSEAVQPATIVMTVKDAANNTVAGSISYNAGTNTATFTPANLLSFGTTYTITVSGAKDNANNTMTQTNWSFTTVAANPSGIWPNNPTPTLPTSGDPSAIEVGVKFRSSVDGYITGIRFYKDASNTGTHLAHLWTSGGTLLATGTFSGETASGWQQVNFSSPVAISANTTYIASYFAPNGNYASDGNYFASGVTNGQLTALANGVDGGNGVFAYNASSIFPTSSFNAINYWVDPLFTTGLADVSAPTVSGQTPPPGATGVSVATTASAVFNEAVQSGTITMTVKDAANNSVAGSILYNAGNNTVTFTPSSSLAVNTTYTVTISGAKDLANNLMSPVNWSFTTATSTSSTIWQDSVTPAVPADSDPGAVEVGTKFRSSASGYITGIRFYKGVTNTGTHVGHLWSSTGTLLASGTFFGESSSGWQTLAFSTPVAISANTTYVASYFAPNGHYAVDAGYFAASGVTAGPLTALGNGVDGGNGVFLYSASGGFPNQSFGSANYWVDVVYSATLPVDATAPTIVVQTPASGATGVPIASAVSAVFSEPVQSGTISMVLKAGATTISGTIAYNSATNTATFTPSSPLSLGTTYTMTVSGAKDLANNTMVQASWSFTTAVTNTTTIWSDSAIPAVTADNDPSSIEVGMKFLSSAGGYITGIRFYKGATNTGTHVAHLWSSTGTLLATGTFSGESASGWQTVTFSNPVAISANTVYVASYYAPNGHYAVNSGYFASTGVTTGPLTALDNTTAGGNGVFLYGAGGGFPNQSFGSNNYWVDVVYAATVPADTTAPTIVAQTPVSGATGVSTATTISVVFSEQVQAATVSIVLKNGVNTIAGATTYDAVTNTAKFTPASALTVNTLYTVTVSGAQDIANNTMLPIVSSFTTAAGTTLTSLWTDSATPAVASENDPTPIEVGTKFVASIDGFITGIRFYKGAANTGTHIGHLWDALGNLLATVTFTGETSSGWQTAAFSTPVRVTAGQTYIASYFAPNGGYADTSAYFASADTVVGPLTAPAGANGVFLYGSSAFPTQSFNSTNYWVDVLFQS